LLRRFINIFGVTAGGKVTLKKTLAMEDSKRQKFTCREVKRIETIVWAIVKHITTSLEDIKDDSDNEIFYTPPQSMSKQIFIKLEDCMFQDHNKRRSKTLLDYHETIVKQFLDLQSASFFVSPKSKRLPATYTVCHFYTLPSAECSGASLEPLVSR
jgi:hypothetical protein